MTQLSIFCDGGARGNPGPAAIGFVVRDAAGKIFYQEGKAVGITTNNVAEYLAVIAALNWLKGQKLAASCVEFFLDAKLVVNQLNGLFKIKDTKLRELLFQVRQLEREVGGKIFYQLISRRENFLADRLVNQALATR